MDPRFGSETSPQSDELRATLEQLRQLAAELRRAEDRERKCLAADLHDKLVQSLVVCRMKLGLLAGSVTTPQSKKTLGEAKQFLDEALGYARTTIADLRPMLLGDADDLQAAIGWVTEAMQRQGLKVTVEDQVESKQVREELLIFAYQAIHELLINVLRHAQTKEAILRVRCTGEYLEICVTDQGRGFDVARLHDPSRVGGFSLIGIRERLYLLGGRLELTSDPEKGTRVQLFIPLS